MANKTFHKIFLLFIILALGTSCRKSPVCDCFEVTGNQGSDDRTSALTYFNQVVANDDINVFLAIGPVEQVIIKGGENLIRNISANVSDNILTLKNENNCNWLRSYKKSTINVYITMPEVTSITNNGVGTIQGTDTITTNDIHIETNSAGDINLALHCNSVNAFLFGSADVTLTGTCSSFECNFFAGTGFLYADHLNTSYTYLSTTSTGDCYVNSSGELDLVINQIGNVYYAGNPNPVHAKINGSGKPIKE
jgi:hypothetical protein